MFHRGAQRGSRRVSDAQARTWLLGSSERPAFAEHWCRAWYIPNPRGRSVSGTVGGLRSLNKSTGSPLRYAEVALGTVAPRDSFHPHPGPSGLSGILGTVLG